uniref:Carboxylic ester hydrolase n=1 Tax=Plutella xylostella TaxID=51655 RepID=A0A1L8D6J4_PLUXY
MTKTTSLIFLFLTVIKLQLCDSSEEENSRLVQISSGRVRGYKNQQWDIFEFYGIPYATAPTGVNKFKGPLPAPQWSDILDAQDEFIVCPQAGDIYKDIAQEDCLVASVFTPNTNETNLPVMVNIHGGGYAAGYGNLEKPYSIVKEGNVVAVTFNYRLGIVGFLCLGTEDVPGNAGLKDMVALLRWVKENIRSFGGNPDDVTIDGCSAGSSAVDLLVLSETTKGLFTKVIAQSGSSISTWSVQQNPIEVAKAQAIRMNFSNANDIGALEDFFKGSSIESLTKDSFWEGKDSSFQFVPCIERDLESEAVLKTAPFDILKQGTYEKYPTLTGFSNMEGLFRMPVYDRWIDEMVADLSDYLPEDLKFETQNERKAVADAARELFFSKLNTDRKMGFIDYFSDVLFTYGVHRALSLQVEAGNENMYFLEFDFVPESGNPTAEPPVGANHCDHTQMVLDGPNASNTSDYHLIKKSMVQLWVNFIKTGKPVSVNTEQYPDGWPAVSSNGPYPYMLLNLKPQLKRNWQPERVQFWDDVYSKYYSTPAPPANSSSRLGSYCAVTIFALALFQTMMSSF